MATPGKFVDLFTALCLWMVVLVYIGIPLAPFIIIRLVLLWLESIIYACLYGYIRMKAEDLVWIEDNPKNLPIINCALLLDGVVSIDEIRSLTLQRLVDFKKNGIAMFPKTRMYFVEGWLNYYWCLDAKFDISNHVYEISCFEIDSVQQLQTQIGPLISKAFQKHNRAPWELVVIPCRCDGALKTAFLWRCHHCVADGMALASFLMAFAPDNLTGNPVSHFLQRSEGRDRGENSISAMKTLLTLKGIVLLPLQIIQMMWLTPPDDQLWRAKVNGRKRVAWTENLDFQTIKELRQKNNATVTDVLLATLGASLHNYAAISKGIKVDRLLCALTVSTRSASDDAFEFSNKFGVVYLPLFLDTSDVTTAIARSKVELNRIKESGEAFAIRVLICWSGLLLPAFVRRTTFRSLSLMSSAVATSIPGPRAKLQLAGRDLQMVTFWSPQRNDIGISFSFMTYADSLVMGVAVDEAVMCEPQQITDMYQKLYSELSSKVLTGSFRM